MTEQTDNEPLPTDEDSPQKSKRRKARIVIPLVILGLPFLVFWEVGKGNSSDKDPERVDPLSTPVVEESLDDSYRKRIVGSWEMDRDGKRLLTVDADGTAKMDVEIEGSWSFLFGSKLNFDIEWTIEDGHLTMKTIGGEPQAKVDLLTSMYGKERVQQITVLDDTTLRLPDDEPDGEDHIWTRIVPETLNTP